jgi:hypothetical protein
LKNHASEAACSIAVAVLLASGAASSEVVVPAGEDEPGWLASARDSAARGIDAYFAADFEEAISCLVASLKELTEGFDAYPVDRGLVERAAVTLILSLHALGREEEAREVASGLAELAPAPHGGDLDLSPDARSYIDALTSGIEVTEPGGLEVVPPRESCSISVDGKEIVGTACTLLPGVHWVRVDCGSGWGDHHGVEVASGEETVLDLVPAPGQETPPPPEGSTGSGGEDLLLGAEPDTELPWYGDRWNLVLQSGGLVLAGVGAGLLGGSLQMEQRAYTSHGPGYVGLERTALDLEVAGWVLMGTGAVFLVVGVIRMAGMEGGR